MTESEIAKRIVIRILKLRSIRPRPFRVVLVSGRKVNGVWAARFRDQRNPSQGMFFPGRVSELHVAVDPRTKAYSSRVMVHEWAHYWIYCATRKTGHDPRFDGYYYLWKEARKGDK